MKSGSERFYIDTSALLPFYREEAVSGQIQDFFSGLTEAYRFSSSQTARVFSHALYIFTTSRWDLYAVVQSTLHEVWARKYSGALETRLRYSPSKCFTTFPFPENLWAVESPGLAAIGEHYHEHRRSLMLSLWLGLTDIYNLFHDRELSPERVAHVSKKSLVVAEDGHAGLLELRRLHMVLDTAIRDAYGWTSLDLEHNFHEVDTLPEHDRVRYTISPAARKTVLSKLLALNLERASAEKEAEQARKAAEKEARKKARGKRGQAGGQKKKDDRTIGMFGEE